MSESNNKPNTDNAFDNEEVGVNQGGLNEIPQNEEPIIQQDSEDTSELNEQSDVIFEYDASEVDEIHDDSYHNLGTTPVPGADEEYYEDYHDGYDPEYIEEEVLRPADHSDKSSELLSRLYGVAGVVRENARLSQTLKSTKRQMLMSMGVNIALASLVVAMIVAFGSYPKTRYIPTSDNRAICEVTPEKNPNITDVTISDFAKDAILNLYTFDYVNYEDQINSSLARWFTASGRVDTINAMSAAGITDFVSKNALTLRAGTTAAAKIEQKGRTPAGQPYWVVRFPMVVDVYSGGIRPEDSQRYIVSVRVIADNASAQNPKGLGVASASLEPQG